MTAAQLPLSARKIGVEWPIEDGGFGVTAHTNDAGNPIIGIYPLSKDGRPLGQPSEYPYQHLMIRIVAGYDEYGRNLIVFADIEITKGGIDMRVLVPPYTFLQNYKRRLFAKWGSPLPETAVKFAAPSYMILK